MTETRPRSCLKPRRLEHAPRRVFLRAGLLPLALTLVACGSDAPSPPVQEGPVRLEVPAGAGSGQPHLAVSPTGEVVLSWLEPDGEGHALKLSRLVDGAWSAPLQVARGDDFFVNWADFPSVQPITPDIWAAHWLRMSPDSFASYDVAFALSTDGGRSFGEGSILNADGVLTEHGFVSLFPWDGAVGAVWLDGRRLAEQFESGVFDPEAPPVGVSLRFARIAYDGTVSERAELDELVCDCCQTDAALTPDGPLLVYRDRSADEIRDIAVRRHVGGAWQPPVLLGPDGWRIEGCPVNGPAVAADGDQVAAAWFTAADGRPRVRFARSVDGGEQFGPAVDLDGAGAFGQVDVVLLEDDTAVVSWWRKAEAGGIALVARTVAPDGRLGELRVVARSEIAQPLDVPQMVASGDRLVFAWTDVRANAVGTATMEVR